MNAKIAKQLTEQNLQYNDDFEMFKQMTEDNIVEAIKNGRRKCVLVRNNKLLESLITHFQLLGYEVKTNIAPYYETYYLFW